MKVSIITINLNNQAGLRETILSVVGQSYADYEYIIIDGGSNDGSDDVIKEFENKITYWISEPDEGIFNAMNKGIKVSNGEYLLFLNSGDCLTDDSILLSVFGVPRKADILYGNINEISSDGTKKVRIPLSGDKLTLLNFNSNDHPTIQQPASFIKRTLYNSASFDESYRIIADIKFFIEMIIFQNRSTEYLPLVITDFRTDGLSSNPSNWSATIEERQRIFKELLPPLIYKDYQLFFQLKDSPLINYIPLLEKTDRLNKFVTFLAKLSLKTHSFFRKFL